MLSTRDPPQNRAVAQIENLQSMQEIQVQSLGCEDRLEKGMAIHSSILASRIPWTEDPGQLQSMGSQTVGHNWATNPTKITWRALPDDSFPLPSFRCLLLHRNANPYLYIYHSNSHTILQRLVYVNITQGIPIRITADLTIETLQARWEWQDILKVMKERK